MNVYVVTKTFPYESEQIQGIFSTLEAADAFKAEASRDDHWHEWNVDAWVLDHPVELHVLT